MTGAILINIFLGSLPLFAVYLTLVGAFIYFLKKTNRL